MNKGRIKVELCADHFERVLSGGVCSTCPSLAENETLIRAVAASARENPRAGMEAIFSELSGIRRTQQEISEKINRLDETIKGNGKPGVLNRITAIETRFTSLQWVIGVSMGVIGIAISIMAFTK